MLDAVSHTDQLTPVAEGSAQGFEYQEGGSQGTVWEAGNLCSPATH